MNFLYAAFGLWLLQQLNDIVNAFLNRKFVPKMFWLSAAASLASGASLFYYIYGFDTAVVNTFNFVGGILHDLAEAVVR